MMKKGIKIFVFLLCFLFGLILYSRYIGIKGLIVKESKVTHAALPASFHGLKIVQITDLHYGTTFYRKELESTIKKINEIHPDIVVLTGDLFDENIPLDPKKLDELSKQLKKINVTIGKYAIKGESDSSNKEWETVMTESNFTNLNDTYDLIYKDDYTPILLAGMSSNLKIKKNPNEKIKQATDFIKLYKETTGKEIYSILMMHEPDFIDHFSYQSFHLILAGHSHGSQIKIPGVENLFLQKGAKKYHSEYYRLNKTDLYISSGLGTGKYPYRFLNRPSIQFYRVTKK